MRNFGLPRPMKPPGRRDWLQLWAWFAMVVVLVLLMYVAA